MMSTSIRRTPIKLTRVVRFVMRKQYLEKGNEIRSIIRFLEYHIKGLTRDQKGCRILKTLCFLRK